jgi:hypothetical protein
MQYLNPKRYKKIDIVMNNGQYLTARDMYLKLYPKLKERDKRQMYHTKLDFVQNK